MSKAVKVSSELAAAAAQEAEVMSRSMAKQIEHWAGLGRYLERSGVFSHGQLLGFLEGKIDFETLTSLEQSVAAEALFEELESFEPSAEFHEELKTGLGSSGLDEHGNIVRI